MKIQKVLTSKRFIIYPAIVGFLTYQLIDMLNGTSFGDLMYESGPLAVIEHATGIPMPFDTMKYYFAYAVGFSYGTMSAFMPLHKMKLGIIGLVLMFLKYWLCLTMFASVAMFWIPLEVVLVTVYKVVTKTIKKRTSIKNAAKVAANINGVPL